MNRHARTIVVTAVPLLLFGMCGCRAKEPSGPRPVAATSQIYAVRAQLTPIAIDRVDSLNLSEGRLLLHGGTTDITVPVPDSADPQRSGRQWALVTDAHVDGVRAVTFTEAQSVTDVSLALPDGDTPIHFAVLAGRSGGDVLIFASGRGSSSAYYGWVTIDRKP